MQALELFPDLPSVATDGKDGHGLTLENVGPIFSSFNNAMPSKIHQKLLWMEFVIWLDTFLMTTGAFGDKL